VVRRARSEESHIPCCKGCSACCSQCLVPLSVPEALRFKEEIAAAPAYRREFVRRSRLVAARHILKHKHPEPLIPQTEELSPVKSVDLNLVSNWYTRLKLRCPFLHNHTCSIYDQRPLACREHFINGSARACEGRHGVAEVLGMPIQLPSEEIELLVFQKSAGQRINYVGRHQTDMAEFFRRDVAGQTVNINAEDHGVKVTQSLAEQGGYSPCQDIT